MNGSRHHTDAGALAGGLICIGLGIFFLLDQLHFANFGHLVESYWPMIIVMVGIPKLLRPRSVWSGLWIIAIGLWLQAVTLHWFDLTYSNSWPLLLIAWGAVIVLRTFVGSMARRGGPDEVHPEASHER